MRALHCLCSPARCVWLLVELRQRLCLCLGTSKGVCPAPVALPAEAFAGACGVCRGPVAFSPVAFAGARWCCRALWRLPSPSGVCRAEAFASPVALPAEAFAGPRGVCRARGVAG